jgi:hypothetical protein
MDATQAKTQKKETPPSQIPQRSVAMHLQEAKLRSGRRAFAMRPSTDDSVVEAMDEETPGLAGN